MGWIKALPQTIRKVNSESGGPYNFGAIPARIALENKQWAKAAELNIHDSEYQWEKFPWEQSLIHFTQVLGASV